MRFYGNGIVWDAEKDCPLARFVGGSLETDDPRTKQLLIAGGYRHEADDGAEAVSEKQADPSPTAPPAKPRVSTALGVQELRDLGRTHGISFKFGTTKEQMVAAINAAK
jgi:hypothetical protein